MVKKLVFFTIGVITCNVLATEAQAQWQGAVARQVVKAVGRAAGKAAGKKVVNRGAETTCLAGPFLCGKTAKAPGPIEPRGPARQERPRRPRN